MFELPDGTILTESKVLMDFVEDAYPKSGYSLLPADPVQRAIMRIAIALVDDANTAWFPIYMKKGYDEGLFKTLKEKI